ncbi:MAG: UbiA family prenyltransferase [bacterium JZ-2024 1]
MTRFLASALALPGVRTSFASVVRDIFALTKPRITLSLLTTSLAGYLLATRYASLAAPDPSSSVRSLWGLLVGLGLIISGASAMNQWLERDTDRWFRRTRNRPLPAGRLPHPVALLIAFTSAPAGTAILYSFAGPLPATLSVTAFFVYGAVYTPLKRVTPRAWIPGALAGAIPPLVGWSASGAPLVPYAWILSATLFLWQLPHTTGLQWSQFEDYQRTGFPMILSTSSSPLSRFTTTVFPSVAILLLSLGIPFPPLTRAFFALICLFLCALMLRSALHFSLAPSMSSGRALFRSSLAFVGPMYLAIALLSLL